VNYRQAKYFQTYSCVDTVNGQNGADRQIFFGFLDVIELTGVRLTADESLLYFIACLSGEVSWYEQLCGERTSKFALQRRAVCSSVG
jgi:hypothetical protein